MTTTKIRKKIIPKRTKKLMTIKEINKSKNNIK